ncbi:TPA: hypothetical protein CPT81_02930 [Candidatus Gastranaerophilales bacterium HUM_20]|nr:pilin [Clostridium sp. CAG:729]DAB23134.1 MAG TPA: hypothetical protein CPT81_02930 [Candidatus Gastranaerophilales bacterium HUM_20]
MNNLSDISIRIVIQNSQRRFGFTLAEDAKRLSLLKDIRHRAFTLAEVLVTLGIIGVVSAMTVPSLMQNYQRQSYVTQLHKVYNELSQAAMQYMTDNNAVNLKEAGLTNAVSIDAFIKKYFKIVKECGTDGTDCYGKGYKKIDGSTYNPAMQGDTTRSYILANGASISFIPNNIAQIHLDVNGAKGPNIIGRDVFALRLYNNGLIDDYCAQAPCSKEERETRFNTYCTVNSDGTWWGCFGKILNDNWEMTY